MKTSFQTQSGIPWWDEAEFIAVAEDVVAATRTSWTRAVEHIGLWQSRTDKLPLGVEASLALLKALLTSDPPGSELALSAAITRFNLVLQLGERHFGLGRSEQAARRLGIPEELVRVRHAVAHGGMPGKQELTRATEAATGWVIHNFWKKEMEEAKEFASDPRVERIKHTDDYMYLLKTLDCYGYLKLYSQWGTVRVNDLSDQPEVLKHISELWEEFQLNRRKKGKRHLSTEELITSDGSDAIRQDLIKFVAEDKSEDRCEILGKVVAAVLVNEELMLPGRELLQSMWGKDEVQDPSENLPKTLLELWRDILVVFSNFLPDVLFELLSAAKHHDNQLSREVASSWIAAIGKSVVTSLRDVPFRGRKRLFSGLRLVDNEVTSRNPKFNYFVDCCLREPSKLLLHILPHIAKLNSPPITEESQRKLSLVIKTYLGQEQEEEAETSDAVHSVEEIQRIDQRRNPWSYVTDADVLMSPDGLLPGQNIETLYGELRLEVVEQQHECDEGDKVLLDPSSESLTFSMVDWGGAQEYKEHPQDDHVQESAEIPAFYRRPHGDRVFDPTRKPPRRSKKRRLM